MARVTIGGAEYEVPEMNFAALERAWPYVEEATMTLDPMKGPAAGICIIAAGLIETDNFDKTKFGIASDEMLGEDQTFERVVKFLKRKIKAKEIEGIRRSIDEITAEAGLEPIPGEAPGPVTGQENGSQATAQNSSQSLLQPDTKEDHGS